MSVQTVQTVQPSCCPLIVQRYITTTAAVFTLIGVAIDGSLGTYLLEEARNAEHEAIRNASTIARKKIDVLEICGIMFIIASISYLVGFLVLLSTFIWSKKWFLILWLGLTHIQMNFGIISTILLLINGYYTISLILIYYILNFVIWFEIRFVGTEELVLGEI